MVALLALGVRAAAGQQAPPDRQRYPLPQSPLPNPTQPALNQAMRYPLPAAGPVLPPWSAATPTAIPAAGQAQVPAGAPVAAANAQIGPQPVLFEPGQIVARVGDKTILYGDVAPTVNMILASPLAKVQKEAERQVLEARSEAERQAIKARSEAERQAIEAQREAVTKAIVQ